MIEHQVDIRLRRHGEHSIVLSTTVRHTCSLIKKQETEDSEYVVDENKLISLLGNTLTDIADPCKVLLVCNDTGIYETQEFRPWGKYFDSYSLFLSSGKKA